MALLMAALGSGGDAVSGDLLSHKIMAVGTFSRGGMLMDCSYGTGLKKKDKSES